MYWAEEFKVPSDIDESFKNDITPWNRSAKVSAENLSFSLKDVRLLYISASGAVFGQNENICEAYLLFPLSQKQICSGSYSS